MTAPGLDIGTALSGVIDHPKRCSAYLDSAGLPSRRSPYKTCPIIVGIVVLAAAFILANILVHIVYAALDPCFRVH